MAIITNNINDRDVHLHTNGAATPPHWPAVPLLNCFLRPWSMMTSSLEPRLSFVGGWGRRASMDVRLDDILLLNGNKQESLYALSAPRALFHIV